MPELATDVLDTVPATFLTVGAGMAGVHWVIRRRDKLAAESSSPPPATPDASSDDEVSS